MVISLIRQPVLAGYLLLAGGTLLSALLHPACGALTVKR